MKALLHYRASPGFRRSLDALRPDWLSLAVVDEAENARFRAELADTDALLHVLKPISAEDIAAGPQLRLIQKIGVGVNTIRSEERRVGKECRL